jgi:D-mannose binding lectin
VRNRENPVFKSEPSVISLSQNGDLILTQSQKLVWSSNASSAESVYSTILHLLDTGNFVLRNHTTPKMMIWQSFYHRGRHVVSWCRAWIHQYKWREHKPVSCFLERLRQPSPGTYSLEIDPPLIRGFIIREI